MNKARKVIILIGLLLIATATIFPRWYIQLDNYSSPTRGFLLDFQSAATPDLTQLAFEIMFILAVTGAALMVVSILDRSTERVRKGLCVKCGYDLRASTGRCPECGTPIPAT